MFNRKRGKLLVITSVCVLLSPIYVTKVEANLLQDSDGPISTESISLLPDPLATSGLSLPASEGDQSALPRTAETTSSTLVEEPVVSTLTTETTTASSDLIDEDQRSKETFLEPSAARNIQPFDIAADPPAGALRLIPDNFPDPVFLNALKYNSKKTIFKVNAQTGFDEGIDLGDNAQFITSTQLKEIVVVKLEGTYDAPSALASLQGIQHFTSLKRLWITYTQVNSIAPVPKSFERLYAKHTKFITADLSPYTALITVELGGAELVAIDVSQNSNLKALRISTTSASTININNNLLLEDVQIFSAPNLTNFNTTNNYQLRKLSLTENQLTSVDLTTNSLLQDIHLSNLPKLTSLQRNTLKHLKKIGLIGIPTLPGVDSFDFSGSPSLDEVKVIHTGYKKVDVSSNQNLGLLTCTGNPNIETLDFSGMKNKLWYIYISDTTFGSFNLTHLPGLKELILKRNKLTSVDLSSNPILEILSLADNDLKDLNLGHLNRLSFIDVSNNHLTKLDLSQQSALTDFYGDGQTRPALTTQDGDDWNVAFANVVGGANLGKVSNLSSPWSYLASTGIARSSSLTETLNYEYDVDNATQDIPPLRVSLALNQAATLVLTPDKPEIESGETVTWTAVFTNLDAVNQLATIRMNVDYLGVTPGSEFTFESNSGTIQLPNSSTSSPLADPYFTNAAYASINPKAAEGETVTATFKTKVSGQPDQTFKAKMTGLLNEGLANPLTVNSSSTVRIKNSDQVVKPNEGDIALRSIPNQFKFHDVTALANTRQSVMLDPAEYSQFTQDKGLYVKVRDSREIAVGWKLTVGMEPLTDTANDKILADAEIHLKNAVIKEVHKPDTVDETIGEIDSPSPPVVASSDIVIKGGDHNVAIMNAQVGGIGTWNLVLPLAEVQLVVPAKTGIAGRSYNSTLNWTLTDAP